MPHGDAVFPLDLNKKNPPVEEPSGFLYRATALERFAAPLIVFAANGKATPVPYRPPKTEAEIAADKARHEHERKTVKRRRVRQRPHPDFKKSDFGGDEMVYRFACCFADADAMDPSNDIVEWTTDEEEDARNAR